MREVEDLAFFSKVGRRLAQDQQKLPPMQLYIIPGQDTEFESTGFTWDVLKMRKRSMELQLTFENPLVISSKNDKEKLEIAIYDRTAFLSEVGLPLGHDPSVISSDET